MGKRLRRRRVTVYPITGKQLFFRVPHSRCEECDLAPPSLVRRVAEEIGDIEVRVKAWFSRLLDALRRGGWHAPVLTIDGRVFSQGVVPDEARLRDAPGTGGASS